MGIAPIFALSLEVAALSRFPLREGLPAPLPCRSDGTRIAQGSPDVGLPLLLGLCLLSGLEGSLMLRPVGLAPIGLIARSVTRVTVA